MAKQITILIPETEEEFKAQSCFKSQEELFERCDQIRDLFKTIETSFQTLLGYRIQPHMELRIQLAGEDVFLKATGKAKLQLIHIPSGNSFDQTKMLIRFQNAEYFSKIWQELRKPEIQQELLLKSMEV